MDDRAIRLYVQVMYDGYNFAGAFAAASLLAILAMMTLGVKGLLEHRLWAESDRNTHR